jgi:Domain of unknown function (DUF5753)/Helix-turn-helix domain
VGAAKLVTVVRSGLAWEMQYIREQQCGLTLEVVCDQMRWQQSKLSRMENGQQCISIADLAALLVIYKVHGQERLRLLHMANRQDDPGYWENHPEATTQSRTLIRLEPVTTAIVTVEPLMVPGLVQTADYARAAARSCGVSTERLDPQVEARMARQSVLTKANPPKVDLILGEIALRQVLGTRKIMAKQLRALLDFVDLPNLRLWVVPFELSGNAGLSSPFHKMDFRRNQSVVFLEQKTCNIFVEDERKMDYFRCYAARLAKVALDHAKSVRLVADIARQHERM